VLTRPWLTQSRLRMVLITIIIERMARSCAIRRAIEHTHDSNHIIQKLLGASTTSTAVMQFGVTQTCNFNSIYQPGKSSGCQHSQQSTLSPCSTGSTLMLKPCHTRGEAETIDTPDTHGFFRPHVVGALEGCVAAMAIAISQKPSVLGPEPTP
jgi:hypothetical protein